MTKRISKIFLAICIVFSMVFTLTVPASAARQGDIKHEYRTLTLNEVDDTCNRLQNAINMKDGSYALSVAAEILKIPVIGNAYSGMWSVIKGDIQNDYSFYNSIRSTMIKMGYSTVTLDYTLVYTRWSVGNDRTYAWKLKSKSVSRYN